MNQVEEVCDRILMVDDGRSVLYGDLEEIRAQYGGHSVLVEAEGEVGAIPGVLERRPRRNGVELVLEATSSPGDVLAHLVHAGTAIRRFEVATPSLNEIFLQVVGGDRE
jgi:ABC-2 type transport system ATP-binding protein